jgi:hypothetical protein
MVRAVSTVETPRSVDADSHRNRKTPRSVADSSIAMSSMRRNAPVHVCYTVALVRVVLMLLLVTALRTGGLDTRLFNQYSA